MCVSSFSLCRQAGQHGPAKTPRGPNPSLSHTAWGGGAPALGRPAASQLQPPTTRLLFGFRDVLGGEKEKQRYDERDKKERKASQAPEVAVRTSSSEGHGPGRVALRRPWQPLPLPLHPRFSRSLGLHSQGAWGLGLRQHLAPEPHSQETIPDCLGWAGVPRHCWRPS